MPVDKLRFHNGFSSNSLIEHVVEAILNSSVVVFPQLIQVFLQKAGSLQMRFRYLGFNLFVQLLLFSAYKALIHSMPMKCCSSWNTLDMLSSVE